MPDVRHVRSAHPALPAVMSMLLSCTDFTFPLLRHDVALDLIRGIGFDAVDLCLVSGASHLRPETIVADGAARWADEIGTLASSRGLSVADVLLIQGAGHRDIPFNHPDPARRARAAELFEAALEFARTIGAGGMTILPGAWWPGEEREAAVERAAVELRRHLARAQESGVRLSVEPHLGASVETPDTVLDLVERCPGLELTVDYGHFVYQGRPEAEVDVLLAHARHVHARGGRRGRLQTSISDNAISFERIVKRLAEQGYDGAIGAEYVWFHGEGAYARCDENDCVSESVLLHNLLREAMPAG